MFIFKETLSSFKHNFNLIDKETGAQTGQIVCPMFHS